jgi:SAM-dependent methyltransferase
MSGAGEPQMTQMGADSEAGHGLKNVLDACCGGRMFWFDQADERAVFVDKRRETVQMRDRAKLRTLVVDPDLKADFRNLPFPGERFAMVIFDPPHLVRCGKSGWLAKKYGRLEADWREDLRMGFAECFRVLRPHGTLIFKWNESQVPVSEILALTPELPVVGNRCGKRSQSHWIVFLKPELPPRQRLRESAKKEGEVS